jgi:hypothetical protein
MLDNSIYRFDDELLANAHVWASTPTWLQVTGPVGIYTDPGHVIEYDDGEVRQEFNICFTARVRGGRLATSTESREVGWVPLDQLDALPMHESTRLRIRHHLDQRALPYIG